jgi:alpha-tubulin suppressor-like RCC1 family protein
MQLMDALGCKSPSRLCPLRLTVIAFSCFVVSGWAATITYPNQAYIFSDGTFEPVPGFVNIKAVAVEDNYVLGVTPDGRVISSGLPERWLPQEHLEQLSNIVSVGLSAVQAAALTGDGRVIDLESEPRWPQPPGLTNVIALDVAGQFGDDDLDYKLAVTSDGRVVTWGHFGFPPSAAVPGAVTAAGGWSHIVALKTNGTVVEWGWMGEPTEVAGLSNVVAVAAGGEHSVALKADGIVVAWGQNIYGQLNIPPGLSNVVAISAAEHHTLALKSDGTMVAWGQHYFGGDINPPPGLSNGVAIACSGTRNVVISALPVPPAITYPNQAYIFSGGTFEPVPGFTNIKAFAVEGNNVLAVTRDGRVIGNGGVAVGQVSNAVAVGLSYVQSAALTADGRVIQFDTGDQPPGLTNVIAFDVFGQYNDDDLDYKLAVTRDGRLVVWDRLEDPLGPDFSIEIPGVISAAGGWAHVVALKSDGTVVQKDWDNPPEQVAGLSNVVAVAAGGTHSLALKADGTVMAWGENFFGQTNVPPGLSNVVAIAAAEDHSLALKRDGTMAAWGQLYFGGDINPPAGLSNVIAIAASGTKNLALVSFPPPRPALTIAGHASTLGALTITLSGEANRVYRIETSAELEAWHFLRNVTNETGSVSFQVGSTNATVQFFRAKLL